MIELNQVVPVFQR